MSEFVRQIAEIFSEAGMVSSLPGFEHRAQQGRMAAAIAGALEDREHLIVEAPTGIGKTLAYLIPALLFTAQRGCKAIISTHTKNLQEQILRKDVPLACGLLHREFPVVALKGRRNYLCLTRLRAAMASTRSLFAKDEEAELRKISAWSLTTRDGDVEELPASPDPQVWAMVCSEPGVCSRIACGPGCFFQSIRERARSAPLVIMNHALFFQLMATQGTEERFIYDDDFVIFDEAQTLESVAGSGIGRRLSRNQLFAALHRLYNPKTRKGLLSRQGSSARSICRNCEEAATQFFESLVEAARRINAPATGMIGSQPLPVRVRFPGLVPNPLSSPLEELQQSIGDLEEKGPSTARTLELTAARRGLLEAQMLIEEFLDLREPLFTYWIEAGSRRDTDVTLCSSPSEVGEIIGPMLFREDSSVIMTSATLSVNNDLSYFRSRIGAVGGRDLVLDSPFDHARQMRIRIAQDMPEPDTDGYAAALPTWIVRCIDLSSGKALVLFTSASLMNSVAAAVRTAFAERGITLLVQGHDLQRHRLLEEFKRDVHSVLFGLDSFWMGIDVPGEALEHVIITRLPFSVPTHPLIEAKLEAMSRRGANAFAGYVLPEAVLKFRQGAGRLLRSREDRGFVTILDSRILRKSYGRIFLASLPRCPVELFSESGETEEFILDDWQEIS